MRLREFLFVISGNHSSGRSFEQEFLVVASEEMEARDELQGCLDCYEPVTAWQIKSGPSVEDTGIADSDEAASRYAKNGAFTVYDPRFQFL